MGLTVIDTATGTTPVATRAIFTGEGCGAHDATGPLFFIGKGTGTVSTCFWFQNASKEPVFARAADAQTSFEVAGTRPV